jgi:hypothetical protein
VARPNHVQLFAKWNIIKTRKSCWKIGHINLEFRSHTSELVRDSYGKWHDYTQVMSLEYCSHGGMLGKQCAENGSAITAHVAWCSHLEIRTNDRYQPGGVNLSNTAHDDCFTMATTSPVTQSGNSTIISETLPLVQISHTAMSLITSTSTMCTVSQTADKNVRVYVLTAAWLKIQFFRDVRSCHWVCSCQWLHRDPLKCQELYTQRHNVTSQNKASSLDKSFTFVQLIGREHFILNRRHKSLQLHNVILIAVPSIL